MPLSVEACPEERTLTDFLQGKLSATDIETIEVHLSSCQPCGDTIRMLDAADEEDDLARSVVEGALLQGFENEQSQVEQLIEALRDRNGAPINLASSELAERAAEVTLLLDPAGDSQSIGRLAQYEVEHLLGAGGTGVVYKAVDMQLQRPVALKVLRPSLGKAARERFLAEARHAAQIDHDNIVTIYHVGQEDTLAYFAMQWLPGQTLEQQLQDETIVSNEMVREIVKQIASGLAAAHEQGLIHRDIKPANIWIEADRGRIKILDFGLARITDDDPRMTETGMIAGTPTFMSPEQARGAAVDKRSDLFSLGCVLFRMTTGQLPFEASNVLATLQSIQRFSPPPPIELNPMVDRDLSDLTLSLLAKHPTARPQNADDVIHALEADQSQWRFDVPPALPVAPRPTVKPKTPDRIVVWFIATVLLLLIGIGSWMFGPQIVRIATGKGQIVIESDDPNVEILVMQDGRQVTVIDTATKQSIDIREGVYQLKAVGEGNSIKISPDRLRLYRGDKKIVEVTIIEDVTKEGQPRSVQTTSSSREPVFQGKSQSYWVEQAKIEKSPQELKRTVEALKFLCSDNNAIEIVDTIMMIARQKRTIDPSTRTDLLAHSIVDALRSAPPNVVAGMSAREINEGNLNSREVQTELLRRLSSDSELVIEFKDRAKEIVPKVVTFAGSSNAATRSWALTYLAEFFDETELDPNDFENAVPILTQALHAPNDYASRTFYTAARVLVESAPQADGLVAAIVAKLQSVSFPKALSLLERLGPRAAEAVPVLDKMIFQDNFYGTSAARARPMIYRALGSIGPDAASALPTLEKLSRQFSEGAEKRAVDAAIKLIKGAEPGDSGEAVAQVKPLEYWITQVKNSQSSIDLVDALEGITSLANAENLHRTLPAFMLILRKYQKTSSGNLEDRFVKLQRAYINKTDAKQFVITFCDEVNNGNALSRNWLTEILGALDRLEPTKTKRIEQALSKNCSQLLGDIKDFVELNPDENHRWAREFLVELLTRTDPERDQVKPLLPILASNFNQLRATWIHEPGSFGKIIKLVDIMIKYDSTSPALAHLLTVDGFDANSRSGRRSGPIYERLILIGPNAADVVPALVSRLTTRADVNESKKIIEVLGAIGPEANAALTVLQNIREQRPSLAPSINRAVDKIRGDAALYKGQPLDYWLERVKTERSQEELVSAMIAVSRLVTPERSRESADAMFRVLRLYGTSSLPRAVVITTAFHQLFSALDENAAVQSAIAELEHGNNNSRQAILWMFSDARLAARLKTAWAANSKSLFEQIVKLINSEDEQTSKSTWDLLQYVVYQTEPTGEAKEFLTAELQKRLVQKGNEVEYAVLDVLVRYAPDTKDLPKQLLRALNNAELNRISKWITPIERLMKHARPIAPGLAAFLNDNAERFVSEGGGGVGRIGGGAGGGGAKADDDGRQDNSMPARLLRVIGKYGANDPATVESLRDFNANSKGRYSKLVLWAIDTLMERK